MSYTPAPPKRRRVWPLVAGLAAAITVTVCAVGGMLVGNQVSHDIVPTRTYTPPRSPEPSGQIGPGDYIVGKDIKPGTFSLTTGADGINCYWARVKAFDGDLGSVIANGNVQPGQKAKITVKSSDHGLDLQGDCVAIPTR